MKEPENTEIEFDVNQSTADKTGLEGSNERIVRNWFRVPVEDSGEIGIRYAGHRFDAVNFSKAGISVRIPKTRTLFAPGEFLSRVELTVSGRKLNVTVEVIGIYDDEAGNELCGLRFMGPDETAKRVIDSAYWQFRDRLFKDQ